MRAIQAASGWLALGLMPASLRSAASASVTSRPTSRHGSRKAVAERPRAWRRSMQKAATGAMPAIARWSKRPPRHGSSTPAPRRPCPRLALAEGGLEAPHRQRSAPRARPGDHALARGEAAGDEPTCTLLEAGERLGDRDVVGDHHGQRGAAQRGGDGLGEGVDGGAGVHVKITEPGLTRVSAARAMRVLPSRFSRWRSRKDAKPWS